MLQLNSFDYIIKNINELLNIAFNSLDKNIVELNIFDWNIGAIKCYQSVGFITNPNKSSTSIVQNKKWNVINMTITKNTWEKTYAQQQL